MTTHDSTTKPTHSEIVLLDVMRVFLHGFPLHEYMPLAHALFILNDMTYGQLIAFEPRRFIQDQYPAIQLTSAAITLFLAVEQREITEWPSDDAMIAMWLVTGALKDLNAIVPNASTAIYRNLINEAAPPLYMSGARKTTRRKSKLKKPGYVYVLRSPTGAFKIGYTNNPSNRLRTFSVKLPFEVDYELLIKTDDMRDLEAELHDYFAEKAINGEWFALTADDLAELRKMDGVS